MKLGINNITELPWGTRTAMESMEVAIQSGWGIQHDGDGTHTKITGTSLAVTGTLDCVGHRVGGPSRIASSGGLTAAELTGAVNNYAPKDTSTVRSSQEAVVLRISSDGAYNITGLVAPVAGDFAITDFARLMLFNGGNNTLTLVHNSGSSIALNRFSCPGGANLAIRSAASVWLLYHPGLGNWIVEGI